MSVDVAGKVVVITGASRGLGKGMAEAMAARGVRLGLCARSAPALDESDDVVARRVDVSDEAAVFRFSEQVAERLGPIDLWINNAGVLEPIVFVRELGSEALDRHLAINVRGVLHGTKSYLRHLDQVGREGVLINISSGAALKGYAGWGAYCAGKAAVDRLTECVQLEEAHRGGALRAHAVAPGVVDTDMQAVIRGKSADEFPMVDKFLDLKEREAFNTPSYVADQLLAIAFDAQARPADVVVRLPAQPK
jgi:NAD(P)-dependent dehydrogenase (short-subunit alcohol dehydrogenase family)